MSAHDPIRQDRPAWEQKLTLPKPADRWWEVPREADHTRHLANIIATVDVRYLHHKAAQSCQTVLETIGTELNKIAPTTGDNLIANAQGLPAIVNAVLEGSLLHALDARAQVAVAEGLRQQLAKAPEKKGDKYVFEVKIPIPTSRHFTTLELETIFRCLAERKSKDAPDAIPIPPYQDFSSSGIATTPLGEIAIQRLWQTVALPLWIRSCAEDCALLSYAFPYLKDRAQAAKIQTQVDNNLAWAETSREWINQLLCESIVQATTQAARAMVGEPAFHGKVDFKLDLTDFKIADIPELVAAFETTMQRCRSAKAARHTDASGRYTLRLTKG